MFVRSKSRRLGEPGLIDAPAWYNNSYWLKLFFGAPIEVPLTAQQQSDLANAAVRAHGIDPSTNRPLSPQYTQSIATALNVDPNDPVAMKAAADKVRADELTRVASDFARFKADQDPRSNFPAGVPWGTVALVGGGVLLGIVGLIKLAK